MSVEELVNDESENAEIVAPISDEAILSTFHDDEEGGSAEVGEGGSAQEHEDEESEPRIPFSLATEMIASLQFFWLNMPRNENDHPNLLLEMRTTLMWIQCRGNHHIQRNIDEFYIRNLV